MQFIIIIAFVECRAASSYKVLRVKYRRASNILEEDLRIRDAVILNIKQRSMQEFLEVPFAIDKE